MIDSKNPNIDKSTINSIDGATALKLDEQLEIDTNPSSISQSSLLQEKNETGNDDPSPHGISIENASYIENNLEVENTIDSSKESKEYTPKLFSEDGSHKIEEEDRQNDKLFDHHSPDDEEFEIPAFLRKQKF